MTRDEAASVVAAATGNGTLAAGLAIGVGERRWIELVRPATDPSARPQVYDVLVWIVPAALPASTTTLEIAVDDHGEIVRVEEFR